MSERIRLLTFATHRLDKYCAFLPQNRGSSAYNETDLLLEIETSLPSRLKYSYLKSMRMN